jgi:DNA (cytosine-5)-methyltransferase 1
MTSLRHGSLFSGYGGLDLAIEEAFGARTVWVSDIEPGPCKVLAHRYPGVPNLGDITRIDWPAIAANPDLGVDLISGGSPCQDISTAGRGAGMVAGTRSNLWVEMREAIRVLRPMFVVWENVAAARSAKAASASLPDHLERAIAHHARVAQEARNGTPRQILNRRAAARLMERRTRLVGDHPAGVPALRAIGRVLGDLASLGFDAEWVGLPASGVGAPHRRFREFVLGADERGREWLAAHAAGLGHERPGLTRDGGARPPDGDRGPVALLPTQTTQDGANTAGPSTFGRNTLPLNAVVTLLPTPQASLADHNRANGVDPEIRRGQGRQVSLADVARHELIPTPRATDGDKGGPNQRGSSGDLMLPSAVCQLLPTPTVAERTNRSASPGAATRPPLSGIITDLLPTPSSADALGGHGRRGGKRSDELLKGITTEQAWGPYAAAIARWEAINGPAPKPTTRGKKGNPKLNPAFALWMMGVPAGWVTDVPGVTDNEALRLAGNGVCPPQAAAALRTCVERLAVAESLGGAA